MLSCHKALTSLGSSSNEDGDFNENGKWRLWCVSFLKSKSGILLRKRYFVSLLKSQNGLLIQIIPIFLESYPKLDTLNDIFHPKLSFKLRIRKECILPAVMQNNLNTRYISSLTTLLIFAAIFKTKAQIKRLLLSIYRVVKLQYKRDLHCSSSDHKDKTATQLRCGVLQDFTFPLHISLQDSSSFRPFKAISLCSSHRIQWKVNKLATLSAAVLFFLQDTVDIVDRFYSRSLYALYSF